MNKLIKKTTLHRWYIGLVIWCAVLFLIVWYALIPWGKYEWGKMVHMKQKALSIKNSDLLPGKIEDLSKRVDMLDSLISVYENRQEFNEAQILEELYSIADSAGCKANKVEIGDRIPVEGGYEVPVLINGTGKYKQIGKFSEQIENMKLSTRIRQLSMKKSRDGSIGFNLDFIVIE